MHGNNGYDFHRGLGVAPGDCHVCQMKIRMEIAQRVWWLGMGLEFGIPLTPEFGDSLESFIMLFFL